MRPIPLSEFGRDHWSTLLYVETCVVDAHGQLDRRKLNCNPANHAMKRSSIMLAHDWDDKWSTRLAGHTAEDPHVEPGHCDWDCLEDFVTEGLADWLSYANDVLTLTDRGIALAGQLRAHRARGGQLRDFTLEPVHG